MTLVGRANPSFWTVLQALQRDQSLAAVTIFRNQRRQPPVKRAKRSMTELQKRLATTPDHSTIASELLSTASAIVDCTVLYWTY